MVDKEQKIDLLTFAASFVPGAIASDYVLPGRTPDWIVWGSLGAVTATYHFVEDKKEADFRLAVRTGPFIGAGVAYAACRTQLPPSKAIFGALAGFLAGYFYFKSNMASDKDAGHASIGGGGVWDAQSGQGPNGREGFAITGAPTPARGWGGGIGN